MENVSQQGGVNFFTKFFVTNAGVLTYCSRVKDSGYSDAYNTENKDILRLLPSNAGRKQTLYISIENCNFTLLLDDIVLRTLGTGTATTTTSSSTLNLSIALGNNISKNDILQYLPTERDAFLCELTLKIPASVTTVSTPGTELIYNFDKKHINSYFIPIKQSLQKFERKTLKLNCYLTVFDSTLRVFKFENINKCIADLNCTVSICNDNYIKTNEKIFNY